MGLFQKREISNEAPLYTIGGQETFLVIGLGNIGEDFAETRHNLGFMCLDYFAHKNQLSSWVNKKNLHAVESSGQIGSNRVILAKPTTMMNESGLAASALQRFYRVDDAHTLILHDELAVDFGKVRVRQGGSDAGNNGVKSLVEHNAGNTWRARVGIGPKHPTQIDSYDFVLGKFSAKEKSSLEKIVKGSNVIINDFINSSGQLTSETRSFMS
mgnify:CR=1 FL=1